MIKKNKFVQLKLCFRRKKSFMRRTKFLLTLVKATIYGHVKIKRWLDLIFSWPLSLLLCMDKIIGCMPLYGYKCRVMTN